MRKFLLATLFLTLKKNSRYTALCLLWLFGCGFATTQTSLPGPHNWQKIANLPPGTPLAVHEPFARESIDCSLVWIDNNALACDVPWGVEMRRVVYRRAELQSIERVDPKSEEHDKATAILIGMGIGGTLCGLAAAEKRADAWGVVLAATGGAAIGGVIPAGLFAGMGAPRPQPQFGVRIPLGHARVRGPLR